MGKIKMGQSTQCAKHIHDECETLERVLCNNSLSLKVYLYPQFFYVKEMHFSSPLHQHSRERGQ